ELAGSGAGGVGAVAWGGGGGGTAREDAERRLRTLLEAVDAGQATLSSADGRTFLGHGGGSARVGFLFPGQGSGRGTSGGALRRRVAEGGGGYAPAARPTRGGGGGAPGGPPPGRPPAAGRAARPAPRA